ncbi:quinate/shikimate dehydrogenase [Klebsiella michiganensis]|nr:quinate/shikimate dehydrogenase [Klebsiella michiganensis]
MDEQQGSGRGLFFTVYRVLFALLSFGTGLFFTIWGGKLLSLGGSAWYLLAGLAYLLIAVGYLVRSRYVLPFAILTFLLTLCWALYEVQLSYWGLIPRLVVPALMLMLALWLAATLPIPPAAQTLRQLERLGDFSPAAGDAGFRLLPARRYSSRRGESERRQHADPGCQKR